MDDDLLSLLETCSTFAPLSSRARKKLLPKFQKIELSQNEILYHQGDPSDTIELVQSGELIAILTTENGDTKILGEIEPGETSGELGALSGEPRGNTVKATKNTVLFQLPSEVFVEVCHEHPGVLFAIINPIVSRSQKIVELVSSEKFKKHIAIIPANDEVPLNIFSEKLRDELKGKKSVIVISDYSEDAEDFTPQKIQKLLDEAKTKNTKHIKQKIVYILKSKETPLAKFCLEKIEMIYLVGYENAPIMIANYVEEQMHHFKKSTKNKPELIMLHDEETKIPRDTKSWLRLNDFNLHHHVRLDRSADYNRIIRFIRNKPVALVLGGGGTRGWGHAGAIKAVREVGIPIDIVGGSSVGSIIAASYALTLSAEDCLAHFTEIIAASRNSVSWLNITYPAISLFNAKGLTTVIEKLFGNVEIEDLWLPYFCISTNLAKNSETIHRYGSLWEQIRCSIAIPGVIPPMLQDGELHLDGGLLNNLPVDVMRKIVGHRATIVAVELTENSTDKHKYDFPPILTFWQALLGKLGYVYDYKFPRFIDTFLKALLAGSSYKAQQNSLMADILISLDLSRFPMLHSNKKLENRIVDMGYDTTMAHIKNMKRKK